jgi:UDP-N-acetylglucosamine acyltransferase
LIHPTAIVDPAAHLDSGVSVGPYSVIGAGVEIGAGTWIGPHVVINGPTRIGRDNRIFQFNSLGDAPQDKKYRGEPTHLEIGDRNVIREYCTFNRGTVQDAGVTRVGDDNWIMAYVHIAHDCEVGSNTIFANGASLAGHVQIEDHAILGGFALIYQFCRVGAYSLCAFGTHVRKDVPPYVTVAGQPAEPHGLNVEGLRRRNAPAQTNAQLRQAYRTLYREGLSLEEAKARLAELAAESPEVGRVLRFLERESRHGIVR